MRPRGPAEALERRRRVAMRLLEEGLSLSDVARALGCAPSSVLRWREAARQGGPEALCVRRSPGRPPKLGADEQLRLRTMVEAGARASGFESDEWTAPRLVAAIQGIFGVTYHPAHVARLLRRLRGLFGSG